MTIPFMLFWCRPQYGGSYCEGKNYEVEYCSPNVRHCAHLLHIMLPCSTHCVRVCVRVCMRVCVHVCMHVCWSVKLNTLSFLVLVPCSLQACASDTYRNEQCAALNSVSFNGQFYNWSEYNNERG